MRPLLEGDSARTFLLNEDVGKEILERRFHQGPADILNGYLRF